MRGVLLLLLATSTGCHSIRNGWLDPTVVGNFEESTTHEIRSSLSLEDTPSGIPGASYPTPQDLEVKVFDFPIAAGDTLAIEIYELRERQIPFQSQSIVSATGYVNLPVVGQIYAQGMTVPDFEESLRHELRIKGILLTPEVMVNPLFLQNATYSIFGIGVSASNTAPLRAGTFPIRRPDLNLLEAINQVGGLNEFVTDIYIFRYDIPTWTINQNGQTKLKEDREALAAEPHSAKAHPGNENTDDEPRSAFEDLLDAVEREEETAQSQPSKLDLKMFEPDPTDPYIWVNDEFVPNPAYKRVAGGATRTTSGSTRPAPSPFDIATTSVNWARIAGDTSFRVVRVPAELLRGGDPELNIIIRPGDVIRVVSGEIGVYYVMGQVNRVGPFAFNAEAITLKAAIATAGGLSSLAWPDRCTVYRRIGQREQMIQVDLDRIFAGKEADFFIRRGDIINVGTHPFAPFLQRIRSLTLPNPVTNVGYSFTYARNFADIDSFAARSNPANQPDRFPQLFP